MATKKFSYPLFLKPSLKKVTAAVNALIDHLNTYAAMVLPVAGSVPYLDSDGVWQVAPGNTIDSVLTFLEGGIGWYPLPPQPMNAFRAPWNLGDNEWTLPYQGSVANVNIAAVVDEIYFTPWVESGVFPMWFDTIGIPNTATGGNVKWAIYVADKLTGLPSTGPLIEGSVATSGTWTEDTFTAAKLTLGQLYWLAFKSDTTKQLSFCANHASVHSPFGWKAAHATYSTAVASGLTNNGFWTYTNAYANAMPTSFNWSGANATWNAHSNALWPAMALKTQ